jgi:hypothetical protein
MGLYVNRGSTMYSRTVVVETNFEQRVSACIQLIGRRTIFHEIPSCALTRSKSQVRRRSLVNVVYIHGPILGTMTGMQLWACQRIDSCPLMTANCQDPDRGFLTILFIGRCLMGLRAMHESGCRG